MKWWELFKRRNPEIVSKAGKRFVRNRADHCHDVPFQKMYNQIENDLVLADNAERLDLPAHMYIKGKVVDDESKGFGRPMIIKFTCI